MNKLFFVTIGTLFLVLTGCSSSDSTPALATDQDPSGGVNPQPVQNDTPGQNGTPEDVNGYDHSLGIEEGDPNPGVVPDPILAELTSIHISELGGHKVFAGPTGSFFNYSNVQFDCDGTGTLDAYPRSVNMYFMDTSRANIEWELQRNEEALIINITETTEGSFFRDDVRTTGLVPLQGVMVVGETEIHSNVVARILQYKTC